MLRFGRPQQVIIPKFKRIGAMRAMGAPCLQKLQGVVTELLPCSIFRHSILFCCQTVPKAISEGFST
jgi:hypothetical protein